MLVPADFLNLATERPAKVKELEQAWTRHMEEFRAAAVNKSE